MDTTTTPQREYYRSRIATTLVAIAGLSLADALKLVTDNVALVDNYHARKFSPIACAKVIAPISEAQPVDLTAEEISVPLTEQLAQTIVSELTTIMATPLSKLQLAVREGKIKCFADLHDVMDANMLGEPEKYIALLRGAMQPDEDDDDKVQLGINLLYVAHAIVNRWIKANGLGLLLRDPDCGREDFYQLIATQEETVSVGVSYSDSLGENSCLLQVGAEGNYTCAYLTDIQAKELSDALLAYLALPND